MADYQFSTPRSRREALGGAVGATSLAGLALAGFLRPEALPQRPAHPDAQLLRLAAAHAAIERQRDHLAARYGEGAHASDLNQMHEEAIALRERIVRTRAVTPAGRAAKARIAADLVVAFPNDLTTTDRLVLSLCRDIEASA